MSRAFLICPEPVRELTAGVGTRFLALARVLADAGHEVTLAVPNDPAEGGPRRGP
jgi:NADPH-dependent 2,4-dienoyl-CoA reductase/sulfur reductase-like enzyme